MIVLEHRHWLSWAGRPEAPEDAEFAHLIDQALDLYQAHDPTARVLLLEHFGGTPHSPEDPRLRVRRLMRITGRGRSQTESRVRLVRAFVEGYVAGRQEA